MRPAASSLRALLNMGKSDNKQQRRWAKHALRRSEKAEQPGTPVLEKTQLAALSRACNKGDETKIKNAMSCASAAHCIEKWGAEAKAGGVDDVDSTVLTLKANVLVAAQTGQCPADVQEETNQEYEAAAAYEAHILEVPAKMRIGGKRIKVGPAERLRLRKEDAVWKAALKERGHIDDGTAETQDGHVIEKGRKWLKATAKKRRKMRKDIEGPCLPDVYPALVGDRRGFVVDGNAPLVPGEERKLWGTQQEAHDQATRGRAHANQPRHAERAAKAKRGEVSNVEAVRGTSGLHHLKYRNHYRHKSKFVRHPDASGPWMYSFDDAGDLKDDYVAFTEGDSWSRKKDATWFVSQGEVNKEKKRELPAACMAERMKKA